MLSRTTNSLFLSSVIVVCLLDFPAAAQRGCEPPPLPPASKEDNIFTAQQEADLGDAIAEYLQHRFRLTDDPEMTSYLTSVADRLLKHLPVTGLRPRVYLVDLPDVNALAAPGGRIYVSRKLVTFVRNEDELAGILGHELGHMVEHHTAIDMTRSLRELLNVTHLGDRKDVFEKYHLLLENWRRKPKALRRRLGSHNETQMGADQVGLWAIASAGYAPRSFADVFDRMAETEGKTGNWFSDFLGTTKPSARRLREMLKEVEKLPPGCAEQLASGRTEEFRAWQARVREYTAWRRQEVLHDVAARVPLDPPLPLDLHQVRFSPDGKFLLAQDAGSIYVLSRDPLEILFQIDTIEAYPAQFTPDSRSVVFHDSRYRVEAWDVATRKRSSVHELVFREGCYQSELSSDGKTLACFSRDDELNLTDVENSMRIWEARRFIRLPWGLHHIPSFSRRMMFSSDNRYFVARFAGKAVVFDLMNQEALDLPKAIRQALQGEFIFLGPDRVLGLNLLDPQRSPLLTFPNGQLIKEVTLASNQSIEAPSRGEYVLVRPFKEFKAGILDLTVMKIRATSKTSAVNIYNATVAGEGLDGRLCLSTIPTSAEVPCIRLPASQLDPHGNFQISGDLKWLAMSASDHGGFWNLTSGRRINDTRSFNGGYFTPAGFAYVAFPGARKREQRVIRFDMTSPAAQELHVTDEPFRIDGPVYLDTDRGEEGSFRENVTWKFRDTRNGKLLWFQHFPKDAPWGFVDSAGGTVAFVRVATADTAQAMFKANPGWSERLGKAPEKGDLFLQIFDSQSGKARGELFIRTGHLSFYIHNIQTHGDHVVMQDTQNRVLVYSLSTGHERGRIFGNEPEVSQAAGLLAISNERDQVFLYDLDTLDQVDEFTFPYSVVAKQFSADGKRLVVLTGDQTAYFLDLAAQASSAATH